MPKRVFKIRVPEGATVMKVTIDFEGATVEAEEELHFPWKDSPEWKALREYVQALPDDTRVWYIINSDQWNNFFAAFPGQESRNLKAAIRDVMKNTKGDMGILRKLLPKGIAIKGIAVAKGSVLEDLIFGN